MSYADRDSYVTCKELEEEIFNSESNSKYFKISGFVKLILNDDRIFYMACPECRKKVSDDYGVMSCVICNKTYKSS